MGIGMLLDMAGSAHPDRVAVGSLREDGPVPLTYADLARIAVGGADVLHEAKARHVVHVGVNGPLFPALLFASAHAGLPITPLNYRLSPAQLADLVGDLDGAVVVADAAYLEALSDCPAPVVAGHDWMAAAAKAGAGSTNPSREDDDAPAVVLFTSGTTSRPKGVVLRHSHLVGYVLQTVDFAAADEDDAILVSVPPYHIAGIGSVLSNVYAGRRMVHLPDFDAARWLDLVRSEAVTQAMLVPTMLSRIVDHLDGRDADAPSLRAVAYGGARMPETVLARALAAFPDAGFTNAYGLTETSSTIAVLGPEDHRAAFAATDPAVRARLGSAGRFVPGVEGQVRDGELWVRGPQVSGEYLGSGSTLDEFGWFPTRDRARIDADGYLFIEGRADDTIIRGGENIAPAEIEDVLIHHPAVREVAVVGTPDEQWGHRITAAVVPAATGGGAAAAAAADGELAEELRAFVRGRLRGSRTPDEIVFREALPYTPTGKLLRRQLAAELAEPAELAENTAPTG
ncbi:class I adenylate-forming enzyme family protein [Streptodolium elevatio]|uniref:Class I adenylate-forming enzyme family protein n=1 Tax=Streptodolium elevatio TaxID=3157996 RepID=A0ABV3DDB0_9ACTN